MLWLGIHLPLLPLEIFEHTEKPLAITNDKTIVAANHTALQKGIESSLNIATALSLSPDLTLVSRDLRKEQQTLSVLAELAYQFSHQVLPYTNSRQEHSLLLEIAGSLKLFDGLHQLLKQVSAALTKHHCNQSGLTHSLAVSSSSQAAEILARFHLPVNKQAPIQKKNPTETKSRVFDGANRSVASVPIRFMDTSAKNIQRCQDMGLENIGDLIKLPAAALRKRFKPDFFLYLQKIRGEDKQLPQFFIPPDHFIRERYFIDGLRSHEDLQHPIRSLIQELCYYLSQRQWQCLAMEWVFTRFSRKRDPLQLQFSQPQSRIESLLQLTQLQLDQIPLDSPIESITLKSHAFCPIEQQNQDLFNQHNRRGNPLLLADTLTGKLGKQSLYCIEYSNQHLPEKKNVSASIKKNTPSTKTITTTQTNHATKPTQPAWLLKTPKPLHIRNQQLYQGSHYLQIVQGPERIETLWWQYKTSRDYFIAAIKKESSGNKHQGLCWIFYDRLEKTWYLHGLFG